MPECGLYAPLLQRWRMSCVVIGGFNCGRFLPLETVLHIPLCSNKYIIKQSKNLRLLPFKEGQAILLTINKTNHEKFRISK